MIFSFSYVLNTEQPKTAAAICERKKNMEVFLSYYFFCLDFLTGIRFHLSGTIQIQRMVLLKVSR